MTITLLEIGKNPDEPFHVTMMLPLPAETPFGNFQLKWMDMFSRLNEVNRQIITSYNNWQAAVTGSIEDSMEGVFNTHRFSTEYAVSGMRRVADEFVALIWCLQKLEETGDYPKRIEIDMLGLVLKHSYDGPKDIFKRNIELIKLLNDLSNTFKHSFIQSDIARIGKEEPLILALNLERADLKNTPKPYVVRMSEFVAQYNKFFHDCHEWLHQWCRVKKEQ
ncbi:MULTISPECIES: hypothetical protein [unclassified Pseudomonas]|uniref:hypothetical protein n=1 Tax=unclassified Pseudomonas TaxID=196821 RepID=UPI000A1F13E7|nr:MULTISPECIES: hypothetical protein [unclassified Pseudomonas]